MREDVGFELAFSSSDDVINIMLAFLTNTVPLFSYLSKRFLTQIMKKDAIVEISTKKKIICDTKSINIWISADEAYRFTDFLNIMSS